MTSHPGLLWAVLLVLAPGPDMSGVAHENLAKALDFIQASRAQAPADTRDALRSAIAALRAELRLAPKPTVVCGLRLIPANPNIDPGIRRQVPEGGPRFLIRSVDPKLCRRE